MGTVFPNTVALKLNPTSGKCSCSIVSFPAMVQVVKSSSQRINCGWEDNIKRYNL